MLKNKPIFVSMHIGRVIFVMLVYLAFVYNIHWLINLSKIIMVFTLVTWIVTDLAFSSCSNDPKFILAVKKMDTEYNSLMFIINLILLGLLASFHAYLWVLIVIATMLLINIGNDKVIALQNKIR